MYKIKCISHSYLLIIVNIEQIFDKNRNYCKCFICIISSNSFIKHSKKVLLLTYCEEHEPRLREVIYPSYTIINHPRQFDLLSDLNHTSVSWCFLFSLKLHWGLVLCVICSVSSILQNQFSPSG